MIPNTYNPVLFLKKGITCPLDALVETNFKYRDKEYFIVNSNEILDYSIPHAPGKSGQFGQYTYFWMGVQYEPNDVFIVFERSLEIATILSLLINEYIFDTTWHGYYRYPGVLSANVLLTYPQNYRGIEIRNATTISNEFIKNIFDKIDKLTMEDTGYFTSATYLIHESKIRFYKGEDSSSITSAISAVEAIYTRPNKMGIYSDIDTRFSLKERKKEKRFKEIFCNNTYSELIYNSIENNFGENPYAVRSGHLHSGKIKNYNSSHPRKDEDNDTLKFILRCQEIVHTSLDKLLIQ